MYSIRKANRCQARDGLRARWVALEWKEQSVPIESIRAGDRVATGEAIDQISQTSRVNSRQWRRVGLMLYGADHSGNEKTVQCEVLVPDSWLEKNGARRAMG